MAIIEFIVVLLMEYVYINLSISRLFHFNNLHVMSKFGYFSAIRNRKLQRWDDCCTIWISANCTKNYDGQKLISHQAWDTLCHVYKLLKFSRCFELQIFWFWFQCNFVVGNQVHSCSRRQASLWFHFLIIKERVLLSWYSHSITISVGYFRDIGNILRDK